MNIEIDIWRAGGSEEDFSMQYVVPPPSTTADSLGPEKLIQLAEQALENASASWTRLAHFEDETLSVKYAELDAPLSLEAGSLVHVELLDEDSNPVLTLRATRSVEEPTVTDPTGKLTYDLGSFAFRTGIPN